MTQPQIAVHGRPVGGHDYTGVQLGQAAAAKERADRIEAEKAELLGWLHEHSDVLRLLGEPGVANVIRTLAGRRSTMDWLLARADDELNEYIAARQNAETA